MILSQKQTEEKLGVGSARLLTMIKEGMITPVNKMPDGAKKFFRKFDSVTVNKLAAEMKSNGKPKVKVVVEVPKEKEPEPTKGIHSLLLEINEKLDKLVKTWI